MPSHGTTTARGYGHAHQAERRRWRPIVKAGQAQCHATHCVMPTRAIHPGTPWDMGHTDDRTQWTGPEHRRCNRKAGAHKANRLRRQRKSQGVTRTSRDW